ncbi:MAG: glucosidase [Candidatus Eisenbacteria bacterium]|nr:glucosidase [Candidatus Eisenbacteria bacterium]
MAHAEAIRLEQDARRERNWKRCGPYLAERQWGTVREDYSADGDAWAYFPHDHARSRAYRWGEDGLLGITDRECRLCFALGLWNGRDPILKERLFGLSGAEGNHGEDAKECWFYLDATPTHSYLKALYKYPQAEFPYAKLKEESARRGADEPEYELADTGVFDDGRYFDVFAEYAKAAPDDILIRITVANRGPEAATLHLLPTLWFRNTWSWGREGEGYGAKPRLWRVADGLIQAEHTTLGSFQLAAALGPYGRPPGMLFTENETNFKRLYGVSNTTPFVKDAFHRFVVNGQSGVVNPGKSGTRSVFYYRVEIPPREQFVFRLRLCAADEAQEHAFGQPFDALVERRRREADEFHAARTPAEATLEEGAVFRQARAGLLWSEQFYHYVVKDWLEGDPAQPAPPPGRAVGRNRDWPNLHARDVLSVSDKWEYPWFAAWDLAFHALSLASLDPGLAKHQLVLFLREWYMHPNGQLPACELALGDVNPPMHAWACWQVYQTTGAPGGRDRLFLERTFQKLLLDFTWWVNRKDTAGNNLFAGGFLGLDNIGVFDRSRPLPGGATLEQADGTAWMAFFCSTMLAMALELAGEDPAYEDVASKFFEHFVAIADAMNRLGGSGLWDEQEGFYYDQLLADGRTVPLRVRSMVGLLPLIAAEVLEQDVMERLPGFMRRVRWFLENRRDLSGRIAWMETGSGQRQALLAIPSRDRLERVLRVMLDEDEFLSPHGLRSLSRAHAARPFVLDLPGGEHRVEYEPGESTTRLFGGNSNWRGPVWFPLNHLVIEALGRYHRFYGDAFTIECPTGSGRRMDLGGVASELANRLSTLFLRGADGRRPCDGDDPRFALDPHWRDLVLFHEYFHGDTGRGLGASHQTGWTALAVHCLLERARARAAEHAPGLGVTG